MSYYSIKTGTVRATGERVAHVVIQYDEAAIAAIKAIPGRRFSKESKSWIVPIEHLATFRAIVDAAQQRYLAELLAKTGGLKGNSADVEHADEMRLNGGRR